MKDRPPALPPSGPGEIRGQGCLRELFSFAFMLLVCVFLALGQWIYGEVIACKFKQVFNWLDAHKVHCESCK